MNNAMRAIEMKANQTKPDEPALASEEGRAGLIALALVVIFMLLAVFAPDGSPSSLFFAALAAWALVTVIVCVVGARKRREYKAALAAWDKDRAEHLYEYHDRTEDLQSRAPAPRLEVSWGARYTPDTPDDEVTWFDEYADPKTEAIAAVDDGVRQGLGSVLLRRERVVFGWSAPHEVTPDAPTPLVDGALVDVVALELRYLNGTLQVDRDGTGLSSTGDSVPLALLYTDSDGDGWLRLHPADSPVESRGFDRVHIIVPAPSR